MSEAMKALPPSEFRVTNSRTIPLGLSIEPWGFYWNLEPEETFEIIFESWDDYHSGEPIVISDDRITFWGAYPKSVVQVLSDERVEIMNSKTQIVKIQLFASLKDAAKNSQIEVDLPDSSTISFLLRIVGREYPTLEKWLPHIRVAVNEEYVTNDYIVREGDDIALIPPVSGGAGQPLVAVVERELSLDEVVKHVQAEKGGRAGAICTFLGVVRETSKDLEGQAHDDIEFLDYEAYAPMAEKEMGRIAREAEEKWEAAVALTHRVGRLEVGVASVAIAVATAHRAEGFEACHYVIEELKKRVPIWKKETARDGFWWSEGAGNEE